MAKNKIKKRKPAGLTMDYKDTIAKCTHKVVAPGPEMLFIYEDPKPILIDDLNYIVMTDMGLAHIYRNDMREIPPKIWRPPGMTNACVAKSNVVVFVEEGPKHE